MEDKYRNVIAHEFEDCINRTIQRLENEETHRPFHKALLSPEALFWSRFERSFSTSFGQSVIEKISMVAALAGGAEQAQTQKSTIFSLPRNQLMAIDNHIAHLRHKTLGRPREWAADLESIVSQLGGEPEPVRVISDLWWFKGGINHYMSIKTVKPNIDQTAEAKRDLLKLKLHDPNSQVYFGLYYNPFGDLREHYKWAPPSGIFDFQNDIVILLGRDYWDTLGGIGFYEELLDIADECGSRTREIVGRLNL